MQDTLSLQTQVKVPLQTLKISKENKVTLTPEVTFQDPIQVLQRGIASAGIIRRLKWKKGSYVILIVFCFHLFYAVYLTLLLD